MSAKLTLILVVAMALAVTAFANVNALPLFPTFFAAIMVGGMLWGLVAAFLFHLTSHAKAPPTRHHGRHPH